MYIVHWRHATECVFRKNANRKAKVCIFTLTVFTVSSTKLGTLKSQVWLDNHIHVSTRHKICITLIKVS